MDGRNVNPARFTAGLLFILAASTRALRPTVLTVASKFSRALLVCVWDIPAREMPPEFTVVDEPRDVAVAVAEVFSPPRFNTREPTRTTLLLPAVLFDVAVRLTTVRVVASRAVAVAESVVDAAGVCATDWVAVVVRDTLPRETVFVAPRVADVVDDVLLFAVVDGITRDTVVVPSAKANGAENAIKKKHRGNLLILLHNYNTTIARIKDENVV